MLRPFTTHELNLSCNKLIVAGCETELLHKVHLISASLQQLFMITTRGNLVCRKTLI